MANNPYVNKVEKADGTVIMDISGDTVTPSDVRSGVTFHDRSGAAQQGGLIISSVYDGLDSSSATDALSAKQGKVLNGYMSDTGTIVSTGWAKPASVIKYGKFAYIEIYDFQPSNKTFSSNLPSEIRPLNDIVIPIVSKDGYGGFFYLQAGSSAPIVSVGDTSKFYYGSMWYRVK
jgi:hypothetical protein